MPDHKFPKSYSNLHGNDEDLEPETPEHHEPPKLPNVEELWGDTLAEINDLNLYLKNQHKLSHTLKRHMP